MLQASESQFWHQPLMGQQRTCQHSHHHSIAAMQRNPLLLDWLVLNAQPLYKFCVCRSLRCHFRLLNAHDGGSSTSSLGHSCLAQVPAEHWAHCPSPFIDCRVHVAYPRRQAFALASSGPRKYTSNTCPVFVVNQRHGLFRSSATFSLLSKCSIFMYGRALRFWSALLRPLNYKICRLHILDAPH